MVVTIVFERSYRNEVMVLASNSTFLEIGNMDARIMHFNSSFGFDFIWDVVIED